MKRVAPSEATRAAVQAACGEVISAALMPEGHWHEFRPDRRAYDPGALRLDMESGGALELWSEYVRPIADLRCEPFVLAARYRAGADVPWQGAVSEVELHWQQSPPLSQLLVERRILSFEELAVENIWTDEDIVMASEGVRMSLSDAALEVLVNLQPGALVLSSPSMTEYRSQPTGKIQWLSRTFRSTPE